MWTFSRPLPRDITVCEVTWCNSVSVAEHAVMQILALVRDYIPQYGWVMRGGWNIADAVSRSYDIEGMDVGVVAAGRIGLAVLKRMKPFDVNLHYTDRHRLPASVEQELGLTFHENVESLVGVCDVVSIHCPLHAETEHMFNDELIARMKRGSYIVNTARGKVCDRDAIVRALKSGQLAGYAGDVWFPQPPPNDHPWRVDAQSRHDAPHIRHVALGAGAVRRRRTGDTGVLAGRHTDKGRVPDCAGRRPCRDRGPLLQRGRRHGRLRGGGQVHGHLARPQLARRWS